MVLYIEFKPVPSIKLAPKTMGIWVSSTERSLSAEKCSLLSDRMPKYLILLVEAMPLEM
tara:strand:+ start:161 stop:337 length:177 start_codon:yes stop_codon:yes gene_type:complete